MPLGVAEEAGTGVDAEIVTGDAFAACSCGAVVEALRAAMAAADGWR